MEISLVSGGVDSTIGYDLFCKDTLPVFFHYSRYSNSELEICLKRYKNLKVIYLPIIESNRVFIENRNMNFMGLSCMYINNIEKINIFGLLDDNQVDKNEFAYEKMSNILSLFCKRKVEVYSPTQNYTKSELINLYNNKNNIEHITYSCYNGNKEECMKCDACIRKYLAISDNDIFTNKRLSINHLKEYIDKRNNPIKTSSYKKYTDKYGTSEI